MRRLLLGLTVLSLFFLGACAPRYVKPTIYREATLEELIELIQRRENRIKTIKASLRMGFEDLEKKSSQHCLGVFVFEKPDRFRIKGYPQLGPTLFEIVLDGKSLWIYIPKDGKVYFTPEIKAGASKADFNLQDLKGAFLTSEMISRADISKFLEKREQDYIIYLVKKRLLEKVWIERSNFLVTKIEKFNKDGSLVLEVSFDDYQRVNEIDFPKEVRIYNPEEKRILTLLIQKVRLNEAIKPEIFQFKVPKDVEVIDLDRKD
ncbi:DUF4292 domain-containing protein [bacterium]|nr:DUF4292 domain-containing protein [bacterium]